MALSLAELSIIDMLLFGLDDTAIQHRQSLVSCDIHAVTLVAKHQVVSFCWDTLCCICCDGIESLSANV